MHITACIMLASIQHHTLFAATQKTFLSRYFSASYNLHLAEGRFFSPICFKKHCEYENNPSKVVE